MKKQLFTLALSAIGISAFSQASTVWQPYNSNLDTTYFVRNLSVVDTNTVWGLGQLMGTNPTSNRFTRTIDGANYHAGNFNPDTLSYAPSGISAVDANTAFIVTTNRAQSATNSGQILKTTNGGTTWTNMETTGMYTGQTIAFVDWVHFWDANNGIVFGDPNGNTGTATGDMWEIYRTHNGGTTWARVPDANLPTPISADAGLTSAYTTYKHFMWAGTYNGLVLASSDSGKTWAYSAGTSIGLDGGCNGLAFRDSIHGLAWGTSTTGGPNALVGTSDGGTTWVPVTQSTSVGISAISTIPKTKGYMSVGVDSALTHYVTSVTYNDGASWTVLEAGISNTVRMLSVQMIDSLNGWAGSFSDSLLPYGRHGINRFHLGHKLGCPITLTSTSSSTPFNVCAAGSATIMASGLNTYTWSTLATTASITVTPSVTTSYSVAGTTSVGCANYETFDITVISPTVTAISHTVCPYHSATLSAFGANTYNWSPATFLSSTTGSTVTCTPSVTTVYTVTGTEDLCTAQKTFTVVATGCAGIDQISNSSGIAIYPNPTNGLISISMSSVDAATTLYVTNVIGQEVLKTSIKDINSSIDLSSLQKGIYMLTITNGQNKHVEKIIVQ
jgi:photosystem II stability/assembly factor-like uncharacterized protein